MLFARLCFKFRVGARALHRLVEVDEVGVEVGPVHAGELGLPAHGEAAAAAHTRAVDHDGVHRGDGGNVVFLGREGDEFHHDERADRDDAVKRFACLQHTLQGKGDVALLAVTAVVRHHHELVGSGAEFVLQNDEVFIAEADDGGDFAAHLVQLSHDGERDGAAHAAAHDARLFDALHFGWVAQGPDEVGDALALRKGV